MPAPNEIVEGLTTIANEGFTLAVIWHVAVALALAALAFGRRPSNRALGAALAAPLLSVSAIAFVYENPVNGGMFALLAFGLLGLALRLPDGPATAGPAWASVAGVAMLAFGWLYPHFLLGRSPIAYLYGAPLGVVPCATLSLVIGVALLADALRARAFPLVLGAAGAVYGTFGAARLGVALDIGLIAGSLALIGLVAARLPRDERAEPLNRRARARAL